LFSSLNPKKSSNTNSLSRHERLEELKNSIYELVVLGGGATGAGIALDAASRGIKTALIEKNDFASGTSSKSTKLIHGGLRYLKQLDVQLVRETGTERAILHKLAPHLVLPEKMIMPLVKGGTYGYWSTSLGLKVYDILAKVKGDDRRKMLNKKEAIDLEPLLNEKNLKGAGYYAEYRTDDARLTIELIKTASRYGANVLNYCEALDFDYNDDNLIEGVQCLDTLSQEKFTIKAYKVVSATGPWVDVLRKKDGSMTKRKLHLTKGIHIVIPHDKFPLSQTVYFDVPDGRMIFAIPRGQVTYVGTTDTTYSGNLDRIVCTLGDANYLIDSINNTFPGISLDLSDIESNWAGLRPLIHEDGKSPSELSRKDEIFESPSGLISIAGGKLTGYRKMAERIVNLVNNRLEKKLNRTIKKCHTATIPLTPDKIQNYSEVQNLIKEIRDKIIPRSLNDHHARYLVTTYGSQVNEIIELIPNNTSYSPEEALAFAEVTFGIRNEFIQTSIDFYVRRTGRLFFDISSIQKTRKVVFSILADELKWNKERLDAEHKLLDEWLKDASFFYTEES